MLRPVVLSVLLLSGGLVACDSGGPGDERLPRTSTYATDGTDLAQATAALPDGGLVVGGIAEGRIAPTDGTIAYPLVLRFDEAGLVAGATVYRDGEPDFGGVAGVAPLDDGLAVLVRRDGALVLYRTDRDGRDRRVLFRPPATFAPEGTLLRTHDGGLVFAVYPEVAEADAVFKVTEDGELAWS
ncbi:MAG: hypothetical protein R3362_11315, partial [Rhodothermales bacterium]|nr:hypothetical protein [Rhodothermales bacterium]